MSKRIAILVSGGGTNLQALIDAQGRGELVNGRISASSPPLRTPSPWSVPRTPASPAMCSPGGTSPTAAATPPP